MVKLFTTEWFQGAFESTREVRVSPSAFGRLQFDARRARWHLVIENGRIVRWEQGDIEDPDVELRWEEDTAARVLRRELRGNDALLATEVLASTDAGPYVGHPAPLNLLACPEAASLPMLPGASFTVQYTYRNGPFGVVDYVLEFEDGQLREERLATIDRPDVQVEVDYLAMARVRAGEMSILEALEGGRVLGELGPLAALAGISESAEFHAVELATGRHALALGALGLFDADPMFASAMDALAAQTDVS